MAGSILVSLLPRQGQRRGELTAEEGCHSPVEAESAAAAASVLLAPFFSTSSSARLLSAAALALFRFHLSLSDSSGVALFFSSCPAAMKAPLGESVTAGVGVCRRPALDRDPEASPPSSCVAVGAMRLGRSPPAVPPPSRLDRSTRGTSGEFSICYPRMQRTHAC